MGFTTKAEDGRSFEFASDMVKSFEIPIIRVNSNDIDSLIKVSKFLVRYW